LRETNTNHWLRSVIGGLLVLAVASGCTVYPPVEQTPAEGEGEGEGEPTRVGDGTIGSLDAAANDDAVQSPFDATPSPDGSEVYFTALIEQDGDDVPGVFHVAATGGEPETLAVGEPLQAPVGITIGLDGSTLYIADAAALDDGEGGSGAVLTVPVAGGAPTALAGTLGYAPQGVVVAREGDTGMLWFTGTDPETGVPGVFKTPLSGGAVLPMVEEGSLQDPGGIAAGENGEAYVVDSLGSEQLASLVRIADGNASTMVPNIGVGYPAGVALSYDESVLLVSGIDPVAGTDLVYRVEIDGLAVQTVSGGIDGFAESAGLHRAHDAEVYAWADSEANETGTVYVLRGPQAP
jgi:DNA-binding beta-propeller fold protein YncE